MNRIIRLFLTLALFAIGVTAARADDAADKSSFIIWVEDKISTPDRRITLGNIEGALSSDVKFDKITVSDTTGPYLTINNVHLIWSRTALLTGSLSIDLLEAASITYDRPPVSSAPVLDPAASAGFTIPELPVDLTITQLSVPNVTLGSAVLGEPVIMSVDGAIALAGGALNSNLAIVRTDDKPGKFTVKANYVNASQQLDLDLAVSEPAGGVIATALSIPDRPALDFSIRGAGPITDFSAGISLSANGAELLAGSSTISRRDNGDYGFRTDVGGKLESLISPAWRDYVQGAPKLAIDGIYAADGSVTLTDLSLTSGNLALHADGRLGPDGFPTEIHAGASMTPSGAKIPFPGIGMIDGGNINLSFGGATNSWALSGGLLGVDTGSIKAADVGLVFGGAATDLADPAKRALTLTGGARFEGISATDPALGQALSDAFYLRANGSWTAGSPLDISDVTFENNNVSASYAGKIDGTLLDCTYSLKAADLRPFSGLAGQPLSGAADLIAKGTVDTLTGGFDLALDGKTDNLALGIAQADRLAAGPMTLAGKVMRDTKGLHFDALHLSSNQAAVTLTGDYALNDTSLALSAALNELGDIAPGAKGAVQLEARLSGPGSAPAISAVISAPRLTLGTRNFADGSVTFEGKIDGAAVTGVINANGLLDKAPLALTAAVSSDPDGTRHLAGLTLSAPGTTATGDLALTPAGLIDGSLKFTASDLGPVASLALADIRGAAAGSVILSPKSGQQSAFIKATVKGLQASGVAIGSGSADLAIDDLFGSLSADGRIELQQLRASGVAIASLKADVKPAGAATGFSLTAAGISADALGGYGLGSLGLTATGSTDGRLVNLASARVTAPSAGLSINASGRLPLSGDGLALKLTGALPLTLANPSLAERGTRVTGTADVAVTLSGSLTKPVITGTASTSGATLTDPDTSTRITGLSARVRFDSTRAVIEQLSGSLNRGGSLAASGSVGLGAGLPADIALRITDARLTDGKIATALISAVLTIRGPLISGPIIGGSIAVARAEITIPESMPANTPLIDVTHRLPPPNVKRTLQKLAEANATGSGNSTGGDVYLDLTISAPSKIFVRGRGLDAELGGQLRVTGSISAVQPVGAFNLIRGRVDVIGQRITLTRGAVTLSGDLDPYIDFAATTSANGISVTANVIGLASNPDIKLSSNPDLPQDEILSHFIFGRSLSDLSPLQIAKLALAAAQLGGGAGGDLVGKLRGATGLDDLDVVTDDAGNAAVKAGRYITDNVYLGVTAGSNGQSNVSVNLDLTDNLKARAEVGPSSGSKLGIFYEKEY